VVLVVEVLVELEAQEILQIHLQVKATMVVQDKARLIMPLVVEAALVQLVQMEVHL
jgi:hypothetical protein